jgi:hypothetical protein
MYAIRHNQYPAYTTETVAPTVIHGTQTGFCSLNSYIYMDPKQRATLDEQAFPILIQSHRTRCPKIIANKTALHLLKAIEDSSFHLAFNVS